MSFILKKSPFCVDAVVLTLVARFGWVIGREIICELVSVDGKAPKGPFSNDFGKVMLLFKPIEEKFSSPSDEDSSSEKTGSINWNFCFKGGGTLCLYVLAVKEDDLLWWSDRLWVWSPWKSSCSVKSCWSNCVFSDCRI